MSISERIQQDTKDAMKERDKQRLGTLRMLAAALKNARIDAERPLTDEEEQAVLKRQLKQREESEEAYRDAGREEQAAAEAAEAGFVREYLPEPMNEAEVEAVLERAIEETGASGMKDMGSVMGRAMELSEGRAEGRQLSTMARNRLQRATP